MRKAIVALGLCVCGLGALSACDKGGTAGGGTAPAADTMAAAAAVQDVEKRMLASFQSKDPAKMGADYASDATFMISGHPPISGADNIRKSLGEMAKDPGFKIDFANKKTDVASSGDLAYTEGTYSVGMTDPKTKKVMTEKGTYVTVFRKQSDGSWKAVEDVASPSGPAT